MLLLAIGSQLGILPSSSALTGLPAIPATLPSLVIEPGSEVSTVSSGTRSGTVVVQSNSLAGASSGLLNLLPISLTRVRPPTSGVYVGEALLPMPTKLATKILRWEFVDIAEMLPSIGQGPSPTKRIRNECHPGGHAR